MNPFELNENDREIIKEKYNPNFPPMSDYERNIMQMMYADYLKKYINKPKNINQKLK